ncbi:Arc family DNA-binding protein [Alcanivorax sp.]|nr:Arc family DNA-binding protein [Alcanivorax sp.]MBD3643536.1 Arc family DNA-binding protein [Alcanivorax sp.]
MKPVLRTQTRIPADLAEWLKDKAKSESRSMNGQLVALIREAKQKEAQCA